MRGKSHVARELKRYIEFFHGARAEVFDLNDYLGPDGDARLQQDLRNFFGVDEDGIIDKKAAYSFDGSAKGGFAIVLSSDAVQSTESMWSAHTKWHRRWMAKEVAKLGAELCFIEIIVTEDAGKKYLRDLAQFRGKTLAEAEQLIAEYRDHYVPIQNDGSEQDTPYIQLMDYNQTIVVNKLMRTFVGAEVCHFLASLHPFQHTIYLSRHGESKFNVEKRIGGDSSLSERGVEYSRRLAEFTDYVICGNADDLVCVTLSPEEVKQLHNHVYRRPDGIIITPSAWSDYGDASGAKVRKGMTLVKAQPGYGKDFQDVPTEVAELQQMLGPGHATLCFVLGDASKPGRVPARLWTSSLRRTIETAFFIKRREVELEGVGEGWRQMLGRMFRNLDEVYAGEYDGLTEEEIRERAPDVIAARKRDKLGFRYPRGESYYDIIARLDSVMKHLERVRNPLLLISHQAVLRMVMGWLQQKSREEAIDLEVPQHEVVLISFDGLGGSRVTSHHPLGPRKIHDDGQKDL